MNHLAASALLIFALATASETSAATIGFGFSGTINSVVNSLPNSGNLVGETFSGRIRYNTSPSSSQTFSGGEIELYRFESPPTEFSVTIDGETYVAGSDGVSADDLEIEVYNQIAGDRLAFIGSNASQTIEGNAVRLSLSLNGAPVSLLADTSLPLSLPDLSSFSSSGFQLQAFNGTGFTSGVSGIITNLTPIPEPSCLLLTVLASTGLLRCRR